jgi:O-antigen/teichoic acid export membrane protein/O-antigen ligase
VAWSVASTVASKVSVLAFTLIAIRSLEPERLGQFVTLQAAALLGAVAWDLGMSSLATREVAAGKLHGWPLVQEATRFRALTLPLCLAVFAIAITPMGGVGRVGAMAAGLAVAYLVASGVNLFLQASLNGYMQFRENAFANLAGGLGLVGATLFEMVLQGPRLGLPSLMLALVCGEMGTLVVAGVYLLAVLRRGPASPEASGARTRHLTFRKCTPFAASSVLGVAYNRFDVILVGALSTNVVVGMYGPASRLQDAMYLVPSVLASVLYPFASRMYSEETDPRSTRRLWLGLSAVALPVSIAGAFAATILAPMVVPYVFGREYAGSISAVQLIVWSVPIITLNYGLISLVNARHKAHFASLALASALAAAFVVDIALVPSMGALGAAAGATVREVPSAIVLLFGVYRSGLFKGVALPHVSAPLGVPGLGVAIGAATASALIGLAIALVQPTLPAVLLGSLLLAAALAAGVVFVLATRGNDLVGLAKIGAVVASLAVFTVGFNAVRVASFLTLGDVFLGVSALLLASVWFRAASRPLFPRWMLVALGMLGAAGLLSATNSQSPGADLVPTLELPVAVIATCIGPGLLASNDRRILVLGLIWVWSGVVNAGVGLSDAVLHTSFGVMLTNIVWGDGRTAGLTEHPNDLALACVMALPIVIVVATSSVARTWRAGYALGGLVLLLGMLVSGSRAGMLAGVAGVCAVYLLAVPGFSRGRLILAMAAVLGAVGIIVVAIGPDASSVTVAINRLTGEVSVGESDVRRLDFYQQAITAFSSSPIFGTGYSNVRYAHDTFLQLLQSGGIMAVAGFVLLVGGTMAEGFRLSRAPLVAPHVRIVAMAAVASIFVWLVYGLAQTAIYDRFLFLPFAIILGISFGQHRGERRGARLSVPGTSSIVERGSYVTPT